MPFQATDEGGQEVGRDGAVAHWESGDDILDRALHLRARKAGSRAQTGEWCSSESSAEIVGRSLAAAREEFLLRLDLLTSAIETKSQSSSLVISTTTNLIGH